MSVIQSEWVFVVHRNPCLDPSLDPDERLGELTHAEARTMRVVDQNTGDGSFAINSQSVQNAWLTRWNYVRCYRETEDPANLKFGFFLDSATRVVVSEDEEGGEFFVWQGLGQLSILARAVLYNVSYLPTSSPFDLRALPEDDPEQNWHWTRRPGPILVRCIEEAQSRGVPDPLDNSAIPPVTIDFTRSLDSNGDPWPGDPDPPEFDLPVGDNLLWDAMAKLHETGLRFYMTPDFLLRAWESDQGAMSGVVFEKGINIREAGEQQIGAWEAKSHVLVRGSRKSGVYVYANRDDSDISATIEDVVGRIEGFLEFEATPTPERLNAAGDKFLRTGLLKHDGPTTIATIERTGEVAFVDYFPGDFVTIDIPDVWDSALVKLNEILVVENEVGAFGSGLNG